MAEVAGAPHSHECAHSTGPICICACRGAMHGSAIHGGGSVIRRMADVTIGSGRHPDQIGGDLAAVDDARIATPAARRRHPVTVTVAQVDVPGGRRAGDGPTVTHVSTRIPSDLTTVDDETLMQHFADAAAGGSDHDAQRVWDEMGRREAALANTRTGYTLPRPVHQMSDDELAQAAHDAGGDPNALAQIYGEMDFRDSEHQRQAALDAHAAEQRKQLSTWAAGQTPEDQRLDALLAKGWDFLDAYAEVHNVDPATLHSQQGAGLVERAAGETLAVAVRRQYDEHVHLQYVEAEHATRGHLLNPAGRDAGVDALSLFSGPTSRARKYASEDLLRWWADTGSRSTFAQFRAQVLGRDADKRAAKVTAGAAQGKDFG